MARLEHKTKGAAFIALASGFFCVTGCMVKCGAYMGAYKLAFFRFVIGLGLIATVAMPQKPASLAVTAKLCA